MSINGGELAILAVLALILLGPHKLPDYARKAAQWAKAGRRLLSDARERVKQELGDDDLAAELADLHPSQLDPRTWLRDDADAEAPARRQHTDQRTRWDSEAT